MRIVLIHTLRLSIDPINLAFARLWPEAELVNILDDSLSRDLARAGSIRPDMTDRFLALARYAATTNPAAILFTCSAFGPCIDACRRDLTPLPVFKPNEAMIEEAAVLGGQIGVLASFAPTLAFTPAEFREAAPAVRTIPMMIDGALEALSRGEEEEHDRLAADAATRLGECTAIAIAQFSLT